MAGFDVYFAIAGGHHASSCSEVHFYYCPDVPPIAKSVVDFGRIVVTRLGHLYYCRNEGLGLFHTCYHNSRPFCSRRPDNSLHRGGSCRIPMYNGRIHTILNNICVNNIKGSCPK